MGHLRGAGVTAGKMRGKSAGVTVQTELGAREGDRHLEKCIALSDVYE